MAESELGKPTFPPVNTMVSWESWAIPRVTGQHDAHHGSKGFLLEEKASIHNVE